MMFHGARPGVSSTRLTSSVVRFFFLSALLGGLPACGDSNSRFSPCVATPDCSGGRQCYELSSGAGVCLDTCMEDQALCEDTQACVPTNEAAPEWVCLPGGEVAIGGLCTRSVDCDLGGVCVTEGAFTVCRRACDPATPTCQAGTVCRDWTAGRGYCAPIVSVDMGMTGG